MAQPLSFPSIVTERSARVPRTCARAKPTGHNKTTPTTTSVSTLVAHPLRSIVDSLTQPDIGRSSCLEFA